MVDDAMVLVGDVPVLIPAGDALVPGPEDVVPDLDPVGVALAPDPDGCRDGWGCQSGNCNCWAFKYILSPL